MRVLLVALIAATVACNGKEKADEGDGKVVRGSEAVSRMQGRDAVERGLMSLGLDGRVLRIDLNERGSGTKLQIARAHLTSTLLLLEDSGRRPRVLALGRADLDPKWEYELSEPTQFPVADNGDVLLMVSRHFAHAIEVSTGRSALQFLRGGLAGIRQLPRSLPFSPTGGAAVGNDTFYIPSLGSPNSNKTLESFSLITGQQGWGYRTAGDIATTPHVMGGPSDPKLYFVTDVGMVTCMDAANYGFAPNGTRWDERLEAKVDHDFFVTSDSKGSGGSIFLVDREGMVYCLNRITGERRWVNATGSRPRGGPKVFGNTCVVKLADGLCGFDTTNVSYRLVVVNGPDEGKSFWVRAGGAYTMGRGDKVEFALSDKKVADAHVTFAVEGEVLTATSVGENAVMVGGSEAGKRATLRSGTRVAIGSTVLAVEDRGSAPLWRGLKWERIVGRVGDTLLAQTGSQLAAVSAWTGETLAGPVSLTGARIIPANTGGTNVFVIGGSATVYALFPR